MKDSERYLVPIIHKSKQSLTDHILPVFLKSRTTACALKLLLSYYCMRPSATTNHILPVFLKSRTTACALKLLLSYYCMRPSATTNHILPVFLESRSRQTDSKSVTRSSRTHTSSLRPRTLPHTSQRHSVSQRTIQVL